MQSYKEQFEYLTQFYTQNVSKEWKCRKFERGLYHNLLKVIVHFKIREFLEIMEQSKVAE